MDNGKRELANKDASATKNGKVTMLEIKFKLNIHGVIKAITDGGNLDVATLA